MQKFFLTFRLPYGIIYTERKGDNKMKVIVNYSRLNLEKVVEVDNKFFSLTEKGREELLDREEYNLENELEEVLYDAFGNDEKVYINCAIYGDEYLAEF